MPASVDAPREFRRLGIQALWVLLLVGHGAWGSTSGESFEIPEQRADLALTEFARQAHLVVLFPYEEVSRFAANRLVGKYSIRDGLDILLKDTGLTAAIEPNRQLVVRVYAGSAGPENDPKPPRRRGLFGMLADALSGSGEPARKQDAAGDAPAQPASQEVTITGSRLRDTGMNTPVPVTVVTSEQLDLAAPGNLIDAFDQLPQFLGSSRPGTSVFIGTDAGQSILNMRGLGENRTLVLLDGRRIVPSTAEGTIDINVLPQSLVKRVEVVTGGASAAYGTDAVAGVTNFILDTSYTGLKGRAQGGITSRGDNANKEGELTFGTAIGSQAHLIAAVDYYRSDAVESYNGRNWFQGWGTVTNPQYTATGQGPSQLVLPHVTSTLYTAGGLINQPGSALNRLTFLADGSAVPLQLGSIYALGGTQSQSGGVGGYDYEADHASDAGLVPDITRYNAFAHLKVDLTDNVQVYGQALFGHNNVNGRGFGSVMFGQYQGTIYQDNAYLPASIRQIMAQENLPSFGFSRNGSSADLYIDRMVQSNSTTSLTAGLKSSLGDWHLNSYYQHGRNDSELQARNFPRTDRLFLAMDAVVDPATGGITCRVNLYQPGYGCVPIDLLGPGRASPQAIAYVTAGTKTADMINTQDAFEISTDGEIFKNWAPGPIQVAFGFDYRKDRLTQRVEDPTNPTNDPNYVAVPVNNPSLGIQGIPLGFAGVNSGVQFSVEANFGGSISVEEAFSEILVPLLKDQPFAKQLNLSLASRWADYTGSGSVWSYKAGLDWQIVDFLRLRGTLSRDVRAADMSERFNAAGGGVTVMDPQFNNEVVTFSEIKGGNPNVRPEKADTYTMGVVIQPTPLKGLSISLDWYSIDIKDAIGRLGAQEIINECQEGARQLCAQITRDPVTNQITALKDIYLNINANKVLGTDIEADYATPLGRGRSIAFRLLGSYLGENSISNVGAPTEQQAGTTGSLSLPHVQLNAGINYNQGPYSAYVQERFISAGKRLWNDNDPAQGGITIDDDHVASAVYTDLNLGYHMSLPGSGDLQFFLNVTNLLDRPPPRAANYGSFGGTVPTNATLFDVLGRRFVAGFKFNFM